MDPALIRAIERFRRAARTNASSKDIAQVLIDDLKAAGFTFVAAQQATAVDLQAVTVKLQALADLLIEIATNRPAPNGEVQP